MPAPRPSKRPRAGGSSLATVASSTTEKNLNGELDFKKSDGPYWAYFHSLNPWTTIAIALVNYATSGSQS